jgi:TPR repeat protein
MVNLQTPKELNQSGDQYFYGHGVDKNIEVAFTYYKRAADQNNPVGLYNVGKYFQAKNDDKQAFDYYKKAGDLKYPLAFIKMSDMYLNGVGVKKNKKKAFKFLEIAVELNEVEAYHQLGKYYLNGIGVGKNEAKAFELFELSAQNNNTEGMYLLGKLLLNAKKMKNDFESAFFYLDKAAVNNNVNAINFLKELYDEPHPYLKKRSDYYRKEMWFYYDEILANLSDTDALRRCAFAYYNGSETTKINYEKAVKYFKNLYGFDDVDGYFGLGVCYLYGQGVQVDLERAKDYLEIAANRDNSKAKNALGDMYRLGKGVDLDYSMAKDFYLEAAKNNEVESLINLGLLHYRKQIKNATEGLALQFMTKASEMDNGNAYYWLGLFNDKSVGCERNYEKARECYEKAIVRGNVGAKYKLATMIYDDISEQKMSKKKADKNYQYIKSLLIDYINSPLKQDVNTLYSMHLLGEMYTKDNFSDSSEKISRYWFENAAENGFAKSMVKMYGILKNKEPKKAFYWLEKACQNPSDGEELFEMSLVYEEGLVGVEIDKLKAIRLLEQSANFNFRKAIQKLTMRSK